MTGHLLTELPYRSDCASLFEPVADLPWAMWLDSGRPLSERGRYDILVAEPRIRLTTRGGETLIECENGQYRSRRPPFTLLQQYLGPQHPGPAGIPFCGGAVGYFGYDLCEAESTAIPMRQKSATELPDMAIGIYDWALVTDHQERRCWLASDGRSAATRQRWASLVERFSTRQPAAVRTPYRSLGAVQTNLDRAAYAQAFDKIKGYLLAGDCYQVNLTRQFSVATSGDPWLGYQQLRKISAAPFSAYLNLPWGQVLSVSPERFIKVEGDDVETVPIKGTRPRSDDPERDRALAAELAASQKDQAENLMIVDLMRNDLGKSCQVGSVRVPRLFEVQSFATVHHLVSTIGGTLSPGKRSTDLLRGAFPGGSITGAPKIRAMAIIDELEPHRRGVYCGSIGYIGYDGNMDSNIAIRTLVQAQGQARFWAGGGIVIDSQLDAEYQETLDKAAAMLRLMQEVRVESRSVRQHSASCSQEQSLGIWPEYLKVPPNTGTG